MKRVFTLAFGLILAAPALASMHLGRLTLLIEPAHVAPAAVHISVHIGNDTKATVPLAARPIWNASCGLSLSINGPTGGRQDVPDEIDSCDGRAADSVGPKSTLEVSRTLSRKEWFATPGRYVIHLRWQEPGKGALESKPVIIEID